jgi:hypothetical protein
VRHGLLEGNQWGRRRSPWRAGGGGSSWNPASLVASNGEGGAVAATRAHDRGGVRASTRGTGRMGRKSVKGVLGAFYGWQRRGEGRGCGYGGTACRRERGPVRCALELEGAGDVRAR